MGERQRWCVDSEQRQCGNSKHTVCIIGFPLGDTLIEIVFFFSFQSHAVILDPDDFKSLCDGCTRWLWLSWGNTKRQWPNSLDAPYLDRTLAYLTLQFEWERKAKEGSRGDFCFWTALHPNACINYQPHLRKFSGCHFLFSMQRPNLMDILSSLYYIQCVCVCVCVVIAVFIYKWPHLPKNYS